MCPTITVAEEKAKPEMPSLVIERRQPKLRASLPVNNQYERKFSNVLKIPDIWHAKKTETSLNTLKLVPITPFGSKVSEHNSSQYWENSFWAKQVSQSKALTPKTYTNKRRAVSAKARIYFDIEPDTNKNNFNQSSSTSPRHLSRDIRIHAPTITNFNRS